MKRPALFTHAKPSLGIVRPFLFRPVKFKLIVETDNPRQAKQVVQKKNPIWQDKKTNQIWIMVPTIVMTKGRLKEVFVWATLTGRANVSHMDQIKYLNHWRNQDGKLVEKVLRVKKDDYIILQ